VLFVVNGLIKGEIEKPSGQFLGLIVMSLDLEGIEFESGAVSIVLPLSLFRLENHVCLSHGI
jgi:hypothetical protein